VGDGGAEGCENWKTFRLSPVFPVFAQRPTTTTFSVVRIIAAEVGFVRTASAVSFGSTLTLLRGRRLANRAWADQHGQARVVSTHATYTLLNLSTNYVSTERAQGRSAPDVKRAHERQ
jgi:hypothetical protein